MKAKVFHVITKLELGGAQKVTLMTLERLPRDRYELALVSGPDGLLRDWADRIPDLQRVWMPSLVRDVVVMVQTHDKTIIGVLFFGVEGPKAPIELGKKSEHLYCRAASNILYRPLTFIFQAKLGLDSPEAESMAAKW